MANFASNFLNNKPLNVYGNGNQLGHFAIYQMGLRLHQNYSSWPTWRSYNIGNEKPEIHVRFS